MARISGNREFFVFRILMNLIDPKLGTEQAPRESNKKRRENLAKEIKCKTQLAIGESTLRDYIYRYCQKPGYLDFKAETETLSVLTKFIGEGSWERFYNKHEGAFYTNFQNAVPEPDSFHQARDVFTLLEESRSDVKKITKRKEKEIKASPSNPDLLYDMALCHLLMNNCEEAEKNLRNAIECESQNELYHFFLALSLLGGLRPFRHQRHSIEEILKILEKAMQISPYNREYQCLEFVIYKDFHDRIGYDRPTTKFDEIKDEHLVDDFKTMAMKFALDFCNLNSYFISELKDYD